jgi:hypothetical protein
MFFEILQLRCHATFAWSRIIEPSANVLSFAFCVEIRKNAELKTIVRPLSRMDNEERFKKPIQLLYAGGKWVSLVLKTFKIGRAGKCGVLYSRTYSRTIIKTQEDGYHVSKTEL